MNSLLIHSRVPEGTVELEPDAQSSQPPPRGSGPEMQEGGGSGLWFPSQPELGPPDHSLWPSPLPCCSKLL